MAAASAMAGTTVAQVARVAAMPAVATAVVATAAARGVAVMAAAATAAAATTAAAEEFVHHHQPQSYHARGSNIPFGFPLTPTCCKAIPHSLVAPQRGDAGYFLISSAL